MDGNENDRNEGTYVIHKLKMNILTSTRRQLACIIIKFDGMSLSVSWFVVIVVFHWHFELNRVLTRLELDFFRLCVCGVGGREGELTYRIWLIRCIFSAHLILLRDDLLQLLVTILTVLPHQHKHTLQG